ncbi:MAG: efflux RND transporter permease subunit [Planctomycetota bacterium]
MIGVGISEPFIRRPIGTSLLMVAMLIVGAMAYLNLPVSTLPNMEVPTIQVGASLPGANPETVAASLAAPLERRFGQIAGVTEMTSYSGTGSASITIQFSLDKSADSAARDIQAAITAARQELPANLPNPPTWRRSNPADPPVMTISLTSDSLPPEKLYEAASTILVQRISQVNGVSQVGIAGASKSAVRVRVNPTALANMGLGMEDVRGAILAANARGPKGRVEGDESAYMIESNDQLHEAREYGTLILKQTNGSIVRMSNVASVVDDVQDVRQIAWVNRERAVLIFISKEANANVIETVDAIKALLPQMRKWVPKQVNVRIVAERTGAIRESVADVEWTLMISVALVVAIVFLSLGRLWSTFAAASTVPLSLAGTCAGMWLCKYNVDNLSLMALTVAVGFVVDDAIVMIENISRRHELGDNALYAAINGARQIGFTVISISVSLVAVFIPLLFMGGLVGRLFREFAVTLSMAIGISAVVSLTVTPMLCAHFAPRVTAAKRKRGVVELASDAVFGAMLSVYGRGLDVVLRHRAITLAATLGTIALTVYLYVAIPKGFFPTQDNGRIQVYTEAPADTSFSAMVERQKVLGDIVLQNADVESMMSFMGSTANQARFFIFLKPQGVREHTSEEVSQALEAAAADVRGVTFHARPLQDIQVGGRISKRPYLYALTDIHVGELNEFAAKLVDRMKQLPELSSVTTDQTRGGLEARLVVDREAAARYGIAPNDIDAALYNAFGQRQVAIMYSSNDQHRVVLEVDPELLKDPASLEKVYVRAPGSGLQVPLRNLAAFKRTTQPLSVTHQGQLPCVTIAFALAPNVQLNEAAEKIEALTRELEPPEALQASFQGNALAAQSTLAAMSLLILTSLLAVYIVLGVLYESLIHPLTILSTIPSAGVGALLALMAFGFQLDVMSLIGIILLIGIVKKNAIMMIDFALEAEREEGKTAQEAIREACLLRFRPILMTTLAALLGALPLALGRGSGSELRHPLGVAIVGGLLMSQALTLFTTPVVYVALDGLKQRWSTKKVA